MPSFSFGIHNLNNAVVGNAFTAFNFGNFFKVFSSTLQERMGGGGGGPPPGPPPGSPGRGPGGPPQLPLMYAEWAPTGSGIAYVFSNNIFYRSTPTADDITITDTGQYIIFFKTSKKIASMQIRHTYS